MAAPRDPKAVELDDENCTSARAKSGARIPRNPFADHPDVISHTLLFVDVGSYLFVGAVSKVWNMAFSNSSKTTCLVVAAQTPSRLEWVADCGYLWGIKTCAAAALGGHMETLKYLRFKRCPWNELTCNAAALGGHLEILKWCRARYCPWSSSTSIYAACGGNLRTLQWLKDNECAWDGWKICQAAALGGNIRVLRWCRVIGLPWGDDSLYFTRKVTECPWFDIMKHIGTNSSRGFSYSYAFLLYRRSYGHTSGSNTCAAAAYGGQLKALKWLRAKGCPWNKVTCHAAAFIGHLEILAWARSNGCAWDKGTCLVAAAGGHLDVLQWCRANGCPWDRLRCLKAASENGHHEVVRWCRLDSDKSSKK